MTEIVDGLDVSYCQNPTAINWDRAAETRRFVICRSTYGTQLDTQLVRHAAEVRRVAMTLGIYHFWTEHHEQERQLRAFFSAAKLVRLGPGDLLPCVDIEDHGLRKHQPPKYPVRPDWAPRLHAFCTALIVEFGGCVVYISPNDWLRLGKPDWLLELPLWCAHWTERAAPDTPGNRPYAIWQHRVAPLPGIHEAPIDQDRARLPLPVIGDDSWLERRAEQQIEVTLQQTYEENRKKP